MWTIYCVNLAAVSLLKTTAFSMEPNFKLIEDGEFFQMLTYVTNDALGSSNRCRRAWVDLNINEQQVEHIRTEKLLHTDLTK